MFVMWSAYKSAGYNSLQRCISSGTLVWVAELRGAHKRRFIKILQHTFMTPLERESLPQMFFAAAPRSAPVFPGGLLAPQDLLRGSAHMEKLKIEPPPRVFSQPESKYRKVRSANLSKPSCVHDRRGHFLKYSPPTPLAKLLVYILPTICCFVV